MSSTRSSSAETTARPDCIASKRLESLRSLDMVPTSEDCCTHCKRVVADFCLYIICIKFQICFGFFHTCLFEYIVKNVTICFGRNKLILYITKRIVMYGGMSLDILPMMANIRLIFLQMRFANTAAYEVETTVL